MLLPLYNNGYPRNHPADYSYKKLNKISKERLQKDYFDRIEHTPLK
jgi:hypothetical protein